MTRLSEEDLQQPASPAVLFWVFTQMAMQGFGGTIPVAQRVLVDQRRWLSHAQFVETLSMGQVLPGPNVVNMALMIGDRFFGLRGCVAAVSGLLIAPLLTVLALAALYGQLSNVPQVAGALRGMGAASAGLILATGLRAMPTLRKNPLGLPTAALMMLAATLAIGWWRVPLMWVVLGLGTVSMALAFWRLAR